MVARCTLAVYAMAPLGQLAVEHQRIEDTLAFGLIPRLLLPCRESFGLKCEFCEAVYSFGRVESYVSGREDAGKKLRGSF